MSEFTKEELVSSKDERSLLLYFETCMVDQSGRVDTRRMNAKDREIAKKWDEAEFVMFYRLPYKVIENLHKNNINTTHELEFSNEAWEWAHQERRTRSERMIKKAIKNGTKTIY